jgi:hypothetical protein
MSQTLATTEQPSLFSELEMDLITIDQPETRKRYTAERLARCIAKRDAIINALAHGFGLLRIAKAFGVSHHTVSTIRDSRPDLVAIEKKQLSGQYGRVIKMSLDRYEEALVAGKISPAQIPVAVGIFSDKRAQIDGDPGLVIEHRHKIVASADGFRERLKAAVDAKSTGTPSITQQKGPVIDAEVVSDTAPRALVAVPDPDPAGPGPGRQAGGGDAEAAAPAADPMDSTERGAEQKEVL